MTSFDAVKHPELTSPIRGIGKPLVIMADFSDGKHTSHVYSKAQFENMLFSDGSYPTGSMNDYFQEVSYGYFSVVGDVVDWTLVTNSYDYYCRGNAGMGSWPQNSQGLVYDLVTALDPTIDFSQYDIDGDMYVDAITIVFEGTANGSDNKFWPHAWALNFHKVNLDGVWINRFSLVNEQTDNGSINPIGTFCHEYGHVLGAPDLYDYDDGIYKIWDDNNYPVGDWCLMASGSWAYSQTGVQQAGPAHMCAFIKYKYMGWITPTQILTEGIYSIKEVELNSDDQTVYSIPILDRADEYFLVENRNPNSLAQFDKRDAWNNPLDSGLLIMHIDEKLQKSTSRYYNNGQPADSWYRVWVEDPGQSSDLSVHPYLLKFDAAFSKEDSQTEFTPTSTPYNTNANDGLLSNIEINTISQSGSIMTFNLGLSKSESIEVTYPNGLENWLVGSTQNITWTSQNTSSNVKIELSRDGGIDWDILFANTPDDNIQSWVVTGPASENCKIKITDLEGTPKDQSDKNFFINEINSLISINVPDNQMPVSEFWVDIEVGSYNEPVIDISAIAFEFFYTNTELIDYMSDELGTLITNAQKTVVPEDEVGKISASVYRTDGNGNSGNGTVIRLKFKISENASYGETVCFNMGDVQAQNKFGAQIPLALGENPCVEVGGPIVWPGDADNDGDVDIFDIMAIVNVNYWEVTGPVRPNATTDWIGQPCSPWAPESATYCDCNGSGKVDIFDILTVVGPNFGKTHPITSTTHANNESFLKNTTTHPPLSFDVRGYDESTHEFWVDISVGSLDQPVNNMKSMAFELTYSKTINIDYVSFESGAFLLDAQTTVMHDEANAKVSAAVYILSGNGQTGHGVILSIKFKAQQENAVNFEFPAVQAEASDGSSILLSPIAVTIVTKVAVINNPIMNNYALIQNYPNPFNPKTTITYSIPKTSVTEISVYNLNGEKIETVFKGIKSAGNYEAIWNARDNPSGTYFIRMQANDFVQVRKCVLLK